MAGRMFMPRLEKLILAVTLCFVAFASVQAIARQNGQSEGQSTPDAQSQSIADAARRSREQAKNATKPSKVVTDDDLDKSNIKPGAQGLTVDAPAKLETQPPTPDAVAAAATATPSTTDPATAPAATDDPEIAKLKDSIADAEKDADLLRRELALQQDTYLSNPDHEHDRTGKAKVNGLQQQISDKQQDIDRLKTKLAAMQELHHVPPPPVKPAAQPTGPAKP
jgi:type I restriction-modification system DNA methylase subunit